MELISKSFSVETLQALKDLSDKFKSATDKSYDQMKADYSYHMSVMEELGSLGWTVHGSITPHDPRGWIHSINSRGEAVIMEYYPENEIDEMLDQMIQRFDAPPERLYLERAIENYNIGHFTEAAFFFLAIMNREINRITPETLHKLKRQCEEGIDALGKNSYDDLEKKPASRMFLVRDYIPSFSAYAIRTFVDGEEHDLDKGTEPVYLNRNWLMHGRMTRLVKRYECVQLINAFHTLADIEDIIKNQPVQINEE